MFGASCGSLALGATAGAAALRIRSWLGFLIAVYVLAWSQLVAVVALLSVVGGLSRWSLLLANVAALAAWASAWWLRGAPRGPSARGAIGDLRAAARDPMLAVLLIATAAAFAYITALVLCTFPSDWDGLTYHLTRAILWDQAGGVGYVDAGNELRLNANPPVAEIGMYLVALTTENERLAALPQLAAMVGCVVAVGGIARRAGLARPQALYAGLVFASLPIVVLQAPAILNDLVVASFLLATVYFLLGRTTSEAVLGALALALALGTKFSAGLCVPLIVLVAVVVGRGRATRSAATIGAGIVLGTPWYLLNLARTGHLDAGLAEAEDQSASLSVRAVVGTFRALVFDFADLSGLVGRDLLLPVVGGALLAATGLAAACLLRRPGASLAIGGLLSAAAPFVLSRSAAPVRKVWESFWVHAGNAGIAFDEPFAWPIQRAADSARSWYGPVGALLLLAGTARAMRQLTGRGTSLPLAVFGLAPVLLCLTFAASITYDPWRGRLLILGVGLAAVSWGPTLGRRWLTLGVVVLSVASTALALVHSNTRPSGVKLLESTGRTSIWSRSRIEALTAVRVYDGTPELLTAVERLVPETTTLAVLAQSDTYLAPLAGPHLSRRLLLVPNAGQVSSQAEWLVHGRSARGRGCPEAWRTVYSGKGGWHLLQRVARVACDAPLEPL